MRIWGWREKRQFAYHVGVGDVDLLVGIVADGDAGVVTAARVAGHNVAEGGSLVEVNRGVAALEKLADGVGVLRSEQLGVGGASGLATVDLDVITLL